MLVVVFEFLGNLCPDGFKPFALLCVDVLVGNEPCGVGSAGVMVDIQDAIHILTDDVVHHLVYALHPHLVDLCAKRILGWVPDAVAAGAEVELGLEVGIPGHGHSNRIESCFFEHLEQ